MTSFIQLLLAALRGSETNLTAGSINRALFLLAIPMILEMAMESLFAIADIFFVARIGTQAIATVGLTESLLTLVYAMAFGLSTAASALIARRVGETNARAAGLVVAQTILLSLLLAGLLGVSGFIGAKEGLQLMGGSTQLIAYGDHFTRWMFASTPAIILLHTLSGCLRGAGQAAKAMRSLWLANGVNIVLCPLLIFGWGPVPQLGVVGSAVATTIGRTAGVIYQLAVLSSQSNALQIQWRDFALVSPIIRHLLRLAAGATGQSLISSASWLLLTRLVARFGSEAVAGYTIALRILMFSLIPAWGVGSAAATLVGQNLGAGQLQRAERSVWRATGVNVVLLSLIGVLLYNRAEEIVRFFEHDPPVVVIASSCLRVLCLGYGAYAVNMVISGALNGAGDTRTPTWLNFICFWLVQIPLAYLLASLQWGPWGVFWCVPISEMLLALLAGWTFHRGRWKHSQV